MNNQVQWRLDFARNLSTQLCQHLGLCAIVAGGSVARGYSDFYSNLELIIYWDNAPDPEVKRSIIKELGAELRYPNHGHESAFLIKGLPVDIWHHNVREEEMIMEKVLCHYSIDLNENNVLDTIRSCITLYGTEFIRGWKDRAAAFPEELSVRLLQTYLPQFSLRHISFAAYRDNPTAFYALLSDIHLFLVLLALNQFNHIFPPINGCTKDSSP